MENIKTLISGLPDEEAAARFLDRLAEHSPSFWQRLSKNSALLSDVATIAAFSPLLASTMLHDPEYIWWLDRRRLSTGVAPVEELLESLSRFSLTNSTLEPHVLFSRFRRRELLRIYLRDIRRLATIAETTEELSNLADAIIESALQLGTREMDNRFGSPQVKDSKGRLRPSGFCVMALGKLGSRELNYSSDVDLVFLYSEEGSTTGQGSRGSVTNREYFIKLGEHITKLIGERSGEGAAYRVDLRLRPHGRLGALAISVADAVRYYCSDARPWERQVLIRSRACAGNASLFRMFLREVEKVVFSATETVESALQSVASSKQEIDIQQLDQDGYNVKLGRGGIREIEFIAQALQLAYGGKDRWLRSPHTLITLARLSERGLLTKTEYSQLSSAYELLRRTEHILQMENGLQTHTIPDDPQKRSLVALKATFVTGDDFESTLKKATEDVHNIYTRVFGPVHKDLLHTGDEPATPEPNAETAAKEIAGKANTDIANELAARSPRFAPMILQNCESVAKLASDQTKKKTPDYLSQLNSAVEAAPDFGRSLSALREKWSENLLEIVVNDLLGRLDLRTVKDLLTNLAEASVKTALDLVARDAGNRFGFDPKDIKLSVLALGKLGGRGMDYDSDLDVIFVYDPHGNLSPSTMTVAEAYARIVEQFVNVLSAMTRKGSLYRVDLRLRPYGSKGLMAVPVDVFLKYMSDNAEIWEMLAFVKLRAVGAANEFDSLIEAETHRIVLERAAEISKDILRSETVKVRKALENRARKHGSGDVDIKYGEGGMLDIYFATRYLQLRDQVPEDAEDRSTSKMLNTLYSLGSLSKTEFETLSSGYDFLSTLDHTQRLTVGRNSLFRLTNQQTMDHATRQLQLESPQTLNEQLATHRNLVRETFVSLLE